MNDSAVEHNGAADRYGRVGESAFEVAGFGERMAGATVARALALGRPMLYCPTSNTGHVNTNQNRH